MLFSRLKAESGRRSDEATNDYLQQRTLPCKLLFHVLQIGWKKKEGSLELRFMSVRLFVGNLPYNATEAEIRELFASVGPLTSVYLPLDRATGRPRGFAFVEFNDSAAATEAIRVFNNQPFKGRPLAVNEARAREARPHTPGPPSSSQTAYAPRPRTSAPAYEEVPARGAKPEREAPRRKARGREEPKAERVRKGPIREKVGGRFYDITDEEEYDLNGGRFTAGLSSRDFSDEEIGDVDEAEVYEDFEDYEDYEEGK
jgi:RNA recognition motif-containing protein